MIRAGRGVRPRRGPSGGRCRNQGRPCPGHRLPSLPAAGPPPSPHGGGARGHRPLPLPAPASPCPVSSSLFVRGRGRGVPPCGDVRDGDRRNLTLKYLRSECLLILEQSCEFAWKKCCGCSQALLQTDFNVSVLHLHVLSNRSSTVP